MTYNVENLFDNQDDPGKADETYLPLAAKKTAQHQLKCQGASKAYYRKLCLEVDWSDEKVKEKLSRVADVILQVKNGKGPDLLILQEVENLNILERLRQDHLQSAGYKKAIIVEGDDPRGIDVAIFSKWPLASEPKLHEINLSEAARKAGRAKAGSTRGILQARFVLPDQKSLTVFGVHFPSQGSPTPYRRAAIKRLNQLKASLPKDEYVVAGGDFNISAKEEAKEGLFKKELAPEWLISHHIGCKGCDGTHKYRGKWSFLDALLFSKNFKEEGWTVDPKSIAIMQKSKFQTDSSGSPLRFNEGRSSKGVSDHLPLVAEILPPQQP